MELIIKERFLTVEKMQEIYSAFETLNKGLEALFLSPVNLYDITVSYDTSPADICMKFNLVEKNIRAFHAKASGIIGWLDEYYKIFDWNTSSYNIKTEVFRWIDWINDFYNMLQNIKIEYIPLYSAEGIPLADGSGKQLYYIKRTYEVA